MSKHVTLHTIHPAVIQKLHANLDESVTSSAGPMTSCRACTRAVPQSSSTFPCVLSTGLVTSKIIVFRFFRACLQLMKDDVFKYLIKHDVFGPS